MFAALLSIVPSIIGSISDHFADKRKLQQLKTETEMAVKQAITEANIKKVLDGQSADIKWQQEMAKASGESWKDEWFTVVLSIPAIMSFIPGLAPYVTAGFASLGATPEWYQLAFLVAIGASFGVRIWEKLKS